MPPRSPRAPARGRRSGPPREPALPARDAPVAPVAEEPVVAHRAQAGVVDVLDARGAKLVRGDDAEREVALPHPRIVAVEVRVDLLPDLVAAAAGAGPQRRGDRPTRARL